MSGKNLEAALPFLKYPGGKRKLLASYRSFFPDRLKGRYFEPMVGGGSLALSWAMKWTTGISISDLNPDVVQTYREVQRDPYGVAYKVNNLIKIYNNYPYQKDMYRAVREDFNNGNRSASNLVFLNQSGYNGLVRYNKSGDLNTPWGHKTELNESVASRIIRAGELLQEKMVDVVPASDYSWVEECAVEGDLVYFDPPYLVPNGFTQYWKNDFSLQAHINLRDLANRLKGNGVMVRIANANNQQVRDLYSDFDLHEVTALRPINRDKGGRGPVAELLIK